MINERSSEHPYTTLAYARTLAHVGTPLLVPAWGTHVIARRWKENATDATGVYPVACLAADCDLRAGLDMLRGHGFVTVTLVVDGLTGPSIDRLREVFPVVRAFKRHYLVDARAGDTSPTKHHRDRIRRAARRGVDVRTTVLRDILDEWVALYDDLIARHGIGGVARFPRSSFEALAQCEGLTAVAASLRGELIAAQLWFDHGDVVWSHLAASSAAGYANSAAFAVYNHAIGHFGDHVIDLGGAAGVRDSADDGLAAFKAGFSNRTQMSYLVGAVLDASAYRALCAERDASDSDYFPGYRAPLDRGEEHEHRRQERDPAGAGAG